MRLGMPVSPKSKSPLIPYRFHSENKIGDVGLRVWVDYNDAVRTGLWSPSGADSLLITTHLRRTTTCTRCWVTTRPSRSVNPSRRGSTSSCESPPRALFSLSGTFLFLRIDIIG